MRTFTLKTSILQNTNRAVSSSEDNWGSIRPNSYIKFGEDANFYQIGLVSPLFYIKDFKYVNGIVEVEGVSPVVLSPQDCLTITYKEFELLTVIRPLNRGKGYKKGDILTPSGGALFVNPESGLSTPCSLLVNETNDQGEIIQVKLNSAGRYVVSPDKIPQLLGGRGQNASFELEFKLLDNRSICERTIVGIITENNVTKLTLDAKLPEGVIEGKLSVNKWEAALTSNYVGQDKINESYTVVRDYTPFLGLPLTLAGSFSPETVYNLAVNIIDKKMREMQDQINKLKS
jgi:hypothetical protein